jgi:hypothetical protein
MDLKRLIDRIELAGPDECWLWKGAKTGLGYGNVCETIDGKKRWRGAHKLMYELTKGPVPPGKCVCHSCDVRLCCNPAHLWVGSHRDNTRDMMTKGRQRMLGTRGEQSGNSKLTEAQVREILSIGRTMRQVDVASRFGISQVQVSRLLRRESWAHLDPSP